MKALKSISILILVIGIIGWSCKKENSKADLVPGTLLKTKWVLSYIQNNNTNAIINYPGDDTQKINIVFSDTSDYIYFDGICNGGIGKYNYSLKGDIKITDLATTKVFCKYIEWEVYSTSGLHDAYKYRINGNSLEIYSTGTYNLFFKSEN